MRLADLFLLSVTHQTAPLAIRERLAFDPAGRDALLASLRTFVPEAAAIITCNRTELYALAGDTGDTADRALALLAEHAGLTTAELTAVTELYTGEAAARHLFRVAAGLDSLVIGEPQILGQVREAAEAARAAGTGGPILARLFNLAVVAGKRARNETPISRGAGSVSHAAVELARGVLGELTGRRALVIGLGEMGQIVARNLIAHGASDLAVCNRTDARAEQAAHDLGGRAVPWQQLDAVLAEADVVISATGSREPVLTQQRMAPVVERRRERPVLLIDIAVPRDIEPGVGALPGVHLRDLDALQTLRADNLRARSAFIPQVEAIIDEEVAAFAAWCHGRGAVPSIQALSQRAEAIRAAEVEKVLRRLGHLDARDRELVIALSHGLVNTLLHEPITRLKASEEQDALARALGELFGLGEAN